ncbi:hypothetical protein QYY62_05255, partial [Xanthomonas campestris pv. campestris]|uniref:hypothetical protein n=1 Tax=Xanthomonas campestris TaxID=339 RepID=UPI002AD248CF
PNSLRSDKGASSATRDCGARLALRRLGEAGAKAEQPGPAIYFVVPIAASGFLHLVRSKS